ncbi:lysozyme inhibitor LprI family protein [Devosia sp.]|uniref:lysozyme inhibitor LprI family protein n=1 Tax=Devosia sp. TaxID=1871048 RepID=UPI003A93EC40
MLKTVIAALALAVVATPALAADVETDRAEFTTMVDTCVAQFGTIDKDLAACIEAEIATRGNALEARIAEAARTLDEAAADALFASQAAWTDWRVASCAYHAALAPRDADPRELFCNLRLLNARTEQLEAGSSWADFE